MIERFTEEVTMKQPLNKTTKQRKTKKWEKQGARRSDAPSYRRYKHKEEHEKRADEKQTLEEIVVNLTLVLLGEQHFAPRAILR